jgi:group I intron endonuclease
MNSGIYKIINPNGKVYIGQSIHLHKRKEDYYKYNKLGFQIKLRNSVEKYGWDSHIFEIVEECCATTLNERERFWQDFYNSVEKGLNCKLTATKDKSGELSQETKDKIRNTLKDRIRTQQECDAISKGMTGLKRPYSGINIAKGHENNPKSKEWKEKQGKINSKAVIQYDLNMNYIDEFYSTREASRILGIDNTSISRCCNKDKYKSAGGFIFKYK